jgi:hypothetical protein
MVRAELMHRVGTLEALRVEDIKRTDEHARSDEKFHDDVEQRLRAQEFFKAKVLGMAFAGSALGGFVLTSLRGCF